MKLIVLNILFSLIMSPIVVEAPPVEKKQIQGKGIYQYHPDQMPKFLFFPKEKARWEGEKITAKEWELLTSVQKTGFITEYIEEIEKNFYISVQIDPLDYMIGLNGRAEDCKDQCLNKTITSFIDEFLEYEGIVLRGKPPDSAPSPF